MPPPRFPREPILEDSQIAPPYCDLWVSEIVTKPNHDSRRLNVCAVVANRGQAPPSGPILVHTVVVAWVDFPKYGLIDQRTEEWQWWHAGQSLPFRTDWMWAPLYYVGVDYGDRYEVTVTVGDPENLVDDRNPDNNSKHIDCPPFVSPATFSEKMNEPLRRETRTENGERTSTLTIGGKPLKK
jgi:hypothetical protein